MGPVAGGKTWTCIIKCLNIARAQEPSPVDGIRKARITIVRMNYRRAHDTIIPSILKLLPEGTPGWKFSIVKDGPADIDIRLNDPVLGPIWLQLRVRAFGDQDIDSFIRGLETTAFWLNETDELPPDCLGLFYQRAGRFPGPEDRPDGVDPAWAGVFGDFNAPDEDSWVYEQLFLNPKPGVEVYIQPGGREPGAENVQNLEKIRANYYDTMALRMEPWQVKRFIDNKIGMSRVGKPVFPEFRDEFHVSRTPLVPENGFPLRIGIDPGRSCAGLIGQTNSMGLMRLFREVISPNGEAWDARILAQNIARELTGNDGLFEPFLTPELLRFAPDPTYCNQGTGIVAEITWLIAFREAMMEELGICPIYAPHTNFIDPRLAAVRRYLASPDGQARLLLDPSMTGTRRAMNGAYRMVKKQGAHGEYRVEPDKNAASEPADALQYTCLDAAGPVGAAAGVSVREKRRPQLPHRPQPVQAGATI